MSLKQLIRNVGDIIFPPQCLACTETEHLSPNRLFCISCRVKVRFIEGSLCTICGLPFFNSAAESHICGACLEKKPLYAMARAVVSFETVIMEVIHKFKYNRDLALGDALGSLFAEFSFPDLNFSDYKMLIPVPLHKKKLQERGFNQALLLAKRMGKKYSLPVNFSLLKRHKFTLTQTGLNQREREENIKGAFSVIGKKEAVGENIILIDDVFTTGATVNECTRTLLEAGACRVSVLTLARVF